MSLRLSLSRLSVSSSALRIFVEILSRLTRSATGKGAVPADAINCNDVGLERRHQEFSPRAKSASSSSRALHQRAERIAAGLPE